MQAASKKELVDALYCIPADIDRQSWLKILSALKVEGVDDAVAENWSAQASSFNQKNFQATWRSIRSDTCNITAGTLFFIAKQYGFKREPAKAEIPGAELNKKQAAALAENTLNRAGKAPKNHPYFLKKRINPRVPIFINHNNELIVPVMDLAGNVHSLQFINPNGEKRFLPGGAIKGNFYQALTGPDSIVICEGYATGVTISNHYSPKSSVVVAFNAGNLLPVAKIFRAAFPDKKIVIAADNDKTNTGIKKALDTAQIVNAAISMPEFTNTESGSDWNDRWMLDQRGSDEQI